VGWVLESHLVVGEILVVLKMWTTQSDSKVFRLIQGSLNIAVLVLDHDLTMVDFDSAVDDQANQLLA
jgi:hypothetical protein